MWLFTTFGFFSVVQKEGDEDLTVRARVVGDLDRLRERVPALSPTRTGAGRYPYRATVPRRDWAAGLMGLAVEIRYDDYLHAVAEEQSCRRAAVYMVVWELLEELEAKLRPGWPAAAGTKSK